MESDDDVSKTHLSLGLGFRDDLISSRAEQKKPSNLDHHQDDKPFSFLSLALSEPKPRLENDDDDTSVKDEGDELQAKDDLNKVKKTVAAASSLTAISSFCHSNSKMTSGEEDCSTPKKKLRLSKDQISILESSFKVHATLNPKDKNDLVTRLNLRPRQVEVWFQNRRSRIKMKQTEVDRESLKKCCEILREENIRLLKEVRELKSLKQPVPFHIQLPSPAPTFAMCPSCEGTGRSGNPDGDDSPTRSFFSSTDSNNTPKLDFVNPLSNDSKSSLAAQETATKHPHIGEHLS